MTSQQRKVAWGGSEGAGGAVSSGWYSLKEWRGLNMSSSWGKDYTRKTQEKDNRQLKISSVRAKEELGG